MKEYKFPEVLKKLLKKKGMSQRTLANRIGVEWNTVSKWINDSTTPNIMNLIEVASVFNVSIDYLVYGVN